MAIVAADAPRWLGTSFLTLKFQNCLEVAFGLMCFLVLYVLCFLFSYVVGGRVGVFVSHNTHVRKYFHHPPTHLPPGCPLGKGREGVSLTITITILDPARASQGPGCYHPGPSQSQPKPARASQPKPDPAKARPSQPDPASQTQPAGARQPATWGTHPGPLSHAEGSADDGKRFDALDVASDPGGKNICE